MSPEQRPELGHWMREKSDEFDALLFWRLDRAVRGPGDLKELIDYSRKHSKNLVFAEDSFDLSTATGEAMAYIAAVFARLESDNISNRVKAAQAHLRTTDRRGASAAPYGYRNVDADGRGKRLVIDADSSEIVREMVRRVTEGETTGAVAAWLNESGVPTNRDRIRLQYGRETEGLKWSPVVVRDILQSQTLLGYKMHQGNPVLGTDGRPIQAADPILSRDEWQRLQQALGETSVRKIREHGVSPLLGVVECASCGRPLYRHVATRQLKDGPKEYASYRCKTRHDGKPSCPGSVKEEELFELAEGLFLDSVGGMEVQTRRYEPGEDHTEELDQINTSIADLRNARYRRREFTTAEDIDVWDEMMADLLESRDRLAALPQRRAGWVLEGTGELYRGVWERSEWPERGKLIRNAGLKIRATRSRGFLEAHMFEMDAEETLRASERARASA
jgi:DNA invertase Pin-like site-specific DNA recombinase